MYTHARGRVPVAHGQSGSLGGSEVQGTAIFLGKKLKFSPRYTLFLSFVRPQLGLLLLSSGRSKDTGAGHGRRTLKAARRVALAKPIAIVCAAPARIRGCP